MRKLLITSFVLAAAQVLSAQSPLTTSFAGNTSLGAPATFYFDLTVNVPVVITQVDVNTTAVATTPGSIDFYWTPNTYVGNDTNPAVWTLGSSAACVSAGSNVPTPVIFASGIALAPGNYGIALQFNGIGPNYIYPAITTNFSNNELTLNSIGASAGGLIGTAICCTPRTFSGSIYYSIGGSGTVATRTTYGTGCYDSRASFYQLFNAGTFDLSGTTQVNTIQMLFTGTGYVVTPGQSSWYTPTSTNLGLGDDQLSQQALPFTLPYPGGSTNNIWICSNGFVWLESSTAAPYTPSGGLLLTDLARICALWTDLYPPNGGSITFDVDPNNTAVYATWTAVPEISYAANVNTFQVAFFNTGFIELRYQSCTVGSHNVLTGFSPGHGALDPGSVDLSVAINTPLVTAPDRRGLGLGASARPLIGTSLNLDTADIPSGTTLGATVLGFGQFSPGVNLVVAGMPDCFLYASLDLPILFVVSGATASVPIAIPNNPGLGGFHVFAQSASFSPGFNAAGILSSNGVDLRIGNL